MRSLCQEAAHSEEGQIKNILQASILITRVADICTAT